MKRIVYYKPCYQFQPLSVNAFCLLGRNPEPCVALDIMPSSALSSLRCTNYGIFILIINQHSVDVKLSHYWNDVSVLDRASEEVHLLFMVYGIKILCKVGVHNPAVSVVHHLYCFQDCLLCTPNMSESVAVWSWNCSSNIKVSTCATACCTKRLTTVRTQDSYSVIGLRYLHPSDQLWFIFPYP